MIGLRIFVIAFFSVMCLACSSSYNAENVSGEALYLYNSNKDEQAVFLLRRALRDAELVGAESTLSRILIVNGAITGDIGKISEGVSIRERAIKRGRFSGDPASVAYNNYLMALWYDAKHMPKRAEELLSDNCPENRCVLIDEMVSNMLMYPNRLDAETTYLFSGILLKYHIGDDAVLAASLSSDVLIDYKRAASRAELIRGDGRFDGIVADEYCLALKGAGSDADRKVCEEWRAAKGRG